MSAKSQYIKYLVAAKTAISNVNNHQDPEYLTYFTSSGIVVGKAGKVNIMKYENKDELNEEMVHRLENNIPLSMSDLASSLFNHAVTKDQKETEDDHQSILLEEAQILTPQNAIINTKHFVLFTDQITGIVVGKLDLNEIQGQ